MASQMITLPTLLATEKLQPNKSNYATFKVLIEEHAASKGLSGYLDGSITKPAIITSTTGKAPADPTPIFSTAPSREEWGYRNSVMQSMIVTNIIDPIGLGVKRDGTAKECWDSVTNACAGKSEAALSLAESEFQAIKFAGVSRDDLDELLSNIRNKANVIRMLGKTVDDKAIKHVLIHSMPADPRWLGLQGALFASTTTDEAFALIKTVAISTGMPEHTAEVVTSTSTALNTSTQKRRCTNPQCKAINKTSHTFENCYWPGGGKEGQFPPNFRNRRPQANQATAGAGDTGESTTIHRVLMARMEDEDPLFPRATTCTTTHTAPEYLSEGFIANTDTARCVFVSRTFENHSPSVTITFLDSGASDHFFRDWSDFAAYEALSMRTGKSAPIIQRRLCYCRRTVNITFKNALHAPSLSANLISVSQLDKAGYWSKFGGGEVGVYEGKDGMMLLRGRGSDGMYILDVDNTHAKISTTKPVDLAKWHGRMVHGDVDTIREMHAKGLVDNLDITNMTVEGKCISCRAGCQHARPYDGHTDPNAPPLELVAFDLWGPLRVASPGGNIYMMLIVDSGSSHKYVAFLKDKSDDSTIAALDEYHVMAERQTGHKVKRVKTDNAFNSGRWKEYFKTHGIIHEQTSPYSSAQNGLTERAIRTITEDIWLRT
ncbi:Gag-Pol polyprotein [Mycena venus]|uniref:Gag-Pol polyprotein n=1 Tax=Mycena venus TaxID=2733690 RepID=A0A8H6Z4M4_9AGAR|nr:Gag-Pol polyprotein [Mycena venus]